MQLGFLFQGCEELAGNFLTFSFFEKVHLFKRIALEVEEAGDFPAGVEDQLVAVFGQGCGARHLVVGKPQAGC